ncbi:MAG: hypothetical protein AB8B64_16230 [Granulosicoccus sp.]
MKPALHVGAVIGSRTPAAWVGQVLQDIQAHDNMQLSVGLHDKTLSSRNGPTARLRPRLADWLLQNIIDIPHFTYNPWQPKALPDTLLAHELAAHPEALAQCDVILYLTRQKPPLEFSCAEVPVWSADLPSMDVRIKHSLLNRAPFIWVHIWNHQYHSSAERLSTDRIASHALPCQTYSISDLRRLSYSALPGVFMSRLTWMVNHPDRKLDSMKVQEGNLGVFDTDRQHALLDIDTTLDTVTTDREYLFHKFSPLWKAKKLLLRQIYERVHHKLFTEHWQLAVSHSTPSASLQEIAKTPVKAYTCVAAPNDVIWADPHLCQHQGDVYAFFERMHKHNQNAHIAYAKLDKDGLLVESGVALSTDYHLSFPHVFKYEDSYYMIPETASLRSVNLYKAKHFPDQWEHHQELLPDINAADTVLLQHQGRWWMFTNCQSHRSVDERDELHIYYSDTLEGPWQAHALNPVLTGVDRSRMAGPIIHEDGSMFRCSQYGAYRYGYGINISRIDELTPETYRESASCRILPEEGTGWSGCHTFARVGSLTMIDRVSYSRR